MRGRKRHRDNKTKTGAGSKIGRMKGTVRQRESSRGSEREREEGTARGESEGHQRREAGGEKKTRKDSGRERVREIDRRVGMEGH